jgi:ABC-type transporter Mla MlaB component
MPLTFKPSADNKSMLIAVDGRFDLSLVCELWRAVRQDQRYLAEEVIVDMEQVNAVFDSGFVLLLMLRRWSRKVRVINFQGGAMRGVTVDRLNAATMMPESVA